MSMAASWRFPTFPGFDAGDRVDILKIRDAKDVEDAVRAAIAGEQPLEIVGHGSKRAIGQPLATNALLDLSALNAVMAYEPNELIITVQAGAPLADVQSLIDSKNQQFAFEPMDTSVLLGTPRGRGTIGGMIGAGLAGPRRIKAGGARSSARRACGVRFRRQFQDRRPGGEERHRLRPLQVAGRILGHACGHDGSDPQGDAAARKRTHAGAARARRSRRQPGDDGGAGLALRRVGRGASADLGVSGRIGALGGLGTRRRSPCCGWKASRPRSPHRAGSLAKAAGPVRRSGDDRGSRLGGALGRSLRDVPPFAATARSARGRCGGSSVRRLPAAPLARRWRAIPEAT